MEYEETSACTTCGRRYLVAQGHNCTAPQGQVQPPIVLRVAQAAAIAALIAVAVLSQFLDNGVLGGAVRGVRSWFGG